MRDHRTAAGSQRDADGAGSPDADGALADLTATEARAAIRAGELDGAEYRAAMQRRLSAATADSGVATRLTPITESPTGALAFIPVLVKDNIDVAGAATTCGTPALQENMPTADADIVAELRAAGADLVGKTVMHELALGITSNNPVSGPARNPWDSTRVAGGSSGGAAAAVAAGLAPISIGTDTGGSIRIPASFCGVYGFRPSIGRYPTAGVFSLSPTRDALGPIARSMSDIILVDSILSPTVEPVTPPTERGRIGVPSVFLEDLDADVERILQAALRKLADSGHEIVEVDLRGIVDDARAIAFDLVWGEAPAGARAYLDSAGSVSSQQLIEEIEDEIVRRSFTQHFGAIDSGALADVLRERAGLQAALRSALARAGCELLLYPSVPAVAPPLGHDVSIDHNGRTVGAFETVIRHGDLAGTLGMPAVSIPAGLGTQSSLPVGLDIAALPDQDARLLQAAQQLSAIVAHSARPSRITAGQ